MARTCFSAPASNPASSDDLADLVTLAQDGSQEAFARLHHRYHRVVASVVRAETRNEADVADLVQETFTRAWIRLGSLTHPERFRAWLLQIARHTVIDHARALGRRPMAAWDDTDPAFESVTATGPGPAEIAEAVDLAGRLRVAIDGLSQRDAVAVSLAAQFGFGPTEIGEALGISPNNAKVVLHRARLRLRSAVDA